MSYGTGYVPFFHTWLVREGDGGGALDVEDRIRIVTTDRFLLFNS